MGALGGQGFRWCALHTAVTVLTSPLRIIRAQELYHPRRGGRIIDGPSCQETPDVRRRGDAVQDIREQRLGGGDRWSCQLLVISCTPVTLHFEDGLLGVLSLRAQKEEGLQVRR